MTLRWRSAGSGLKTEDNSSAAALRADTGVRATLAQLKESQSPNIYTEQMTTEVSYRGPARKSTIKTTSTFPHADIYSFCLHFLFLKPSPSHMQVSDPSRTADRHYQKQLIKENLPRWTNSLGRRREHSSAKFVWTSTTISQQRTYNTHDIV